tara:strand:+ start:266 stop:589 length:324 start_codon:yes stop_codon:yes gene_type:complete
MYKPLPEEVTIKNSKIHGLGLFATCDLEENHEFGITHISNSNFQDGYARTPLGGFFNHSEDPNCEAYIWGDFIKLRSIREIKEGEELTASYWLYDIEDALKSYKNNR